ncbi:OLC1v1013318C1 [Oldenlandia corymbosa var. corymbosa]|uniref:OLC1v1013318C1 n=1 Tax=Oldenlandia corymbosa var. corymbosa TaxID=529605 RepID=A0AAV1E185_OLDCO|nr:OLC1v1013318C1 [Oldenlandia corymbosa var. corymbosa]
MIGSKSKKAEEKNFSLPEEIMSEIFVRSPVKSLLRFMCVCKSWQALIGSPYFRGVQSQQQLNRHKNDTMDPIKSLTRFCNPVTQEYIKLTFATSDYDEKGTEALGFGFDRFANAYKYVRIVAIWNAEDLDDERVQFAVEICKLGTDGDSLTLPEHPPNQVQEFLILTFDLRAETFGRIEVVHLMNYHHIFGPGSVGGRRGGRFSIWKLTVLDDCLAVVIIKFPPETVGNMLVDVWVMKEYGNKESWTKTCSVGPMFSHVLPRHANQVICLNGDELVAITNDAGLGSWKVGPEEEEKEEEHKITTFHINCKHVKSSSLHIQAVIFQPSLVSIVGRWRKL